MQDVDNKRALGFGVSSWVDEVVEAAARSLILGMTLSMLQEAWRSIKACRGWRLQKVGRSERACLPNGMSGSPLLPEAADRGILNIPDGIG